MSSLRLCRPISFDIMTVPMGGDRLTSAVPVIELAPRRPRRHILLFAGISARPSRPACSSISFGQARRHATRLAPPDFQAFLRATIHDAGGSAFSYEMPTAISFSLLARRRSAITATPPWPTMLASAFRPTTLFFMKRYHELPLKANFISGRCATTESPLFHTILPRQRATVISPPGFSAPRRYILRRGHFRPKSPPLMPRRHQPMPQRYLMGR